MRLDTDVLEIQLKVQDRYRDNLSSLGTDTPLSAMCVILGDSDIDYGLAPNIADTRILSAPYNVNGVKHKLIYNGIGKNLSGLIKCFARQVLSDGSIQSMYDYPASETWSTSRKSPLLVNAEDLDKITFTNATMGYILFFSTVLDYYFDENGIKKRLIEKYDFSVNWNGATTTPNQWDIVFDNDNGSLLISKSSLAPSTGVNYNGVITIVGQFSNKIKKVKFNL
jgi:hypothetical protein